jgi:hypothetical protein
MTVSDKLQFVDWRGFPKKVGSLEMALPSDVRRWLCPAANGVREILGYAQIGRAEPTIQRWILTEGQSRFLTSDGKAD